MSEKWLVVNNHETFSALFDKLYNEIDAELRDPPTQPKERRELWDRWDEFKKFATAIYDLKTDPDPPSKMIPVRDETFRPIEGYSNLRVGKLNAYYEVDRAAKLCTATFMSRDDETIAGGLRLALVKTKPTP